MDTNPPRRMRVLASERTPLTKVRPIAWRKRQSDIDMARSLRELLRQVQRGEVKAIALVLVDNGHELAYGTLGAPAWAQLLAGVTSMQVAMATGERDGVYPGTR